MRRTNDKTWTAGAVQSLTAFTCFFISSMSFAAVTAPILFAPTSATNFSTALPALAKPSGSQSDTRSNALLVVDAGVDNYQSLISELLSSDSTLVPDVLILDRDGDGVQQITRYLAEGHARYASIHVISHGLPGALKLGNATLNQKTLSEYDGDLVAWRNSLSAGADILFYGCEVTGSGVGVLFASALGQLTGADIAASDDVTGSDQLHGNWTLETVIGDVETRSLTASRWSGALAPMEINPVQFPVRESDGMESGAPLVSGGLSIPFSVGDSALWENAGFIGDQAIDVRATLVSFTDNSPGGTGGVSFSTIDDDLWVQVEEGEATVQWDVFASGTGQTIVAFGSPEFRISDIDGDGSASVFPALQVEAVRPDMVSLTSYTFDMPTNLEGGIDGAELLVRGTEVQSGELTSLVSFSWNNVSSWTVSYDAVVGGNTRYFLHDGDGDLSFAAPDTTSFLELDLDGNNSTTPGTGYVAAVFDELGAAVPVADVDPVITTAFPLDATLDGAQVLVTNSYANDELLVNGSSAASGTISIGPTNFSYTSTTVDGHPVITVGGSGTLAEYQSVLQTVTFRNTSSALYGDPRIVEVTVTDAAQSTTSNLAYAIVNINPDTDGDTYLDDVDLDDDNDGVLDTAETPSAPDDDADSDGIPVYLDDDDNDALVGNDDGATETAYDNDRDGVPNHRDLDSDNDGIPDNIEAQTSDSYAAPSNSYDGFGVDVAYFGGLDRLTDIDGDGTDDTKDADSDNDGISDTTEAGLFFTSLEAGVNGLVDQLESADDYSDVNGSFDSTPTSDFPDVDNPGGEPDWRDPQDFDLDTIAGNVDLDDDGDGILDSRENGVVDALDFDDGDLSFSGIWREHSFYASGYLGVTASEGDDYLFASNSDVGLGDTFGTASGLLDTANWLPGVTEFSIEASFPDLGLTEFAAFTVKIYSGVLEIGELTGIAPALNGATTYRLLTHLSADQIAAGISIEVDVPLTGASSLVVLDSFVAVGHVDSDADGVPDSHDLDSDNDGIPDNVEAQSTALYVGPALNDGDDDGLDDAYEFTGDLGLDPVNSEFSGQPDFLDTDSDDDGISDTWEAGLILGVLDVGLNGWDDDAEPADTYADVNGSFNVPATDLPDANGDALSGGDVNFREVDSDGDRINDSDEDMSLVLPTAVGDTNGNDIDDSIDVQFTAGADANGNGIDDAFEPTDTDVDGVPDYVDADSDNDGILDSVESSVNSDGDSIPDYLDLDSDNDGLPDNVEAQATASYVSPSLDEGSLSGYSIDSSGVNTAYSGGLTPVNTDGADTPDYADTDSDNDGESDTQEAGLDLATLSVGTNGLDNDVEFADDYRDVNGTVVQGVTMPDDLPNSDGLGDVDYRALFVPTVNPSSTMSSMPTLTGTHDSDAALSVTVDLATYTEGDGSLTDHGNGSWTLAVSSVLADGVYNVVAVSTLGPLMSTDVTSSELVVDNVAPAVTAADVGPTNSAFPVLSGTTDESAGSQVTVTNGSGTVLCTTTVVAGAPATWSCLPGIGMAEGTTELTATITDQAGNEGSDTFDVIIDVTDPVIAGNDSGPVNETAPLVSGTTQEEAGALVTVYDSGGATLCMATVFAGDPNGWSCTLAAALSEGTHILTASITDAAGNSASDTFTVDIDLTSPTLFAADVGPTSDATPELLGGTDEAAGAVVRISDGSGGLICLATVQIGDPNSWMCESLIALPEGVTVLTATVSDAAGNSASVTFSADIDLSAPSVTGFDVGPTMDTTPELAGTSSAQTGSVVTVLDADGQQVCTGTVLPGEAGNLWSCTPATALPDGNLTLTAQVTDAAGNIGADNFSVIINVSVPEIGIETISTDDVIDGIEDDSDLIISGTTAGADGEDVTVSVNGSTYVTNASSVDGDWSIVIPASSVREFAASELVRADVSNAVGASAEQAQRTVTRNGDIDADGIPDQIEAGADLQAPVDTDGDLVPDYRDIDSDNDGITDLVEDRTAVGTDSDGDGVDDAFDADTSGGLDVNLDGIVDSYALTDSDFDGVPDVLDLDSDNDGIPDIVEAQSTSGYVAPGVDTDQNGLADVFETTPGAGEGLTVMNTDGVDLPDYIDTDSDNDDISDMVEAGSELNGSVGINGMDSAIELADDYSDANGIFGDSPASELYDSDGDAVLEGDADYRDTDSDNDGIPDSIEAGPDPLNPVDTDGDGLADYKDTDSNGDGVADGVPGLVDGDADNDGIADSDENTDTPPLSGSDVDLDGIDDAIDVDLTGGSDANGDGVDDSFAPADTDGDGIPNYLDLDSDNDGRNDAVERGDGPGQPIDTDADGVPDFLDADADGDGIPDAIENITGPVLGGGDADGDGIDDVVDVDLTGGHDLDGNGVDDALDALDTDGDGVPDMLDRDSDNDGIPDATEASNMPPASGTDSDGDGVDNAFDVDATGGMDTNADGLDDLAQPVDTNMDGVFDHLSVDSDGDGISDHAEAGTSQVDGDQDGIDDVYDADVTGGIDSNGDGIDDSVTPPDSDGDSVPDYLDLDSDNDGLGDAAEAAMPDANGDGLVDPGNLTDAPVDSDGDDAPDFLDLDSNNDGIFDVDSAGYTHLDVNDDGRLDGLVDADADGVLDSVDGQPGAFASGRDSDGDGTLDLLDQDSDNDGIPNAVEAPGGDLSIDTDADGVPDYLDLDSDNDGVTDLHEAGGALVDADGDGMADSIIDANNDGLDDSVDLNFTPDDVDGDGKAGFIDLDNDGDGIPDLIESGLPASLDSNGDGMIDRVALGDSDFDGLMDIVDPSVIAVDPGLPVSPVDTDGDGLADYKDLDSDGDNKPDAQEIGDANNDGVPDQLQFTTTAPDVQSAAGGSGSLGLVMLLVLLGVLYRRRQGLRNSILLISS